MQTLTQRLWSPTTRWHLGDLAWTHHQHPGREPDRHTALWHTPGHHPAAWAWINGSASLDLHLDPAHPQLADDILTWFHHTATHTPRDVTILETETHIADALHRHGYQPQTDGPYFVLHHLDLTHLPPPPRPPAGYTLRHLTGPHDASARAAVHRAAFTLPGLPPSRVTTDSYRTVMNAWPYDQRLDWIAETPDGTPVSFCLVWLDPRNHDALIEPAGTHPDHRRRGLAAATTHAALHAARTLGARTARVSPRGDAAHPAPRHLYRSLGFHPQARTITYLHTP
jgi:ribosomal protein S18 acetylase RimI-like enzyme